MHVSLTCYFLHLTLIEDLFSLLCFPYSLVSNTGIHHLAELPYFYWDRHRSNTRFYYQFVHNTSLPDSHREVEGVPTSRGTLVWSNDRRTPSCRWRILAWMDGSLRQRTLVCASYGYDSDRNRHLRYFHVLLGSLYPFHHIKWSTYSYRY
jgi:hypothetical protein